MANFAIAADEKVISKGMNLIERLASPGEKKGETLERLFSVVEAHLDTEIIKQGGVDVAALDASLANIRAMFLSSVSGREELIASYERRITELQQSKLALQEDCASKIEEAESKINEIDKRMTSSNNEMIQAIKDKNAVLTQFNLEHELLEELKDKNKSLNAELVKLKEELVASQATIEENKSLAAKIKELETTLQQEHFRFEQFKVTASLEKDKELLKKEKEYNDQISILEKENAILKTQLESVKDL